MPCACEIAPGCVHCCWSLAQGCALSRFFQPEESRTCSGKLLTCLAATALQAVMPLMRATRHIQGTLPSQLRSMFEGKQSIEEDLCGLSLLHVQKFLLLQASRPQAPCLFLSTRDFHVRLESVLSTSALARLSTSNWLEGGDSEKRFSSLGRYSAVAAVHVCRYEEL